MLGTALYYPHIDVHDGEWLRSAILFWDEIQTITPTAISKPYRYPDTIICEKEGYLQPLRCDLHHDVIDSLGKKMMSLLDTPDWLRVLSRKNDGEYRFLISEPSEYRHQIHDRLSDFIGIHPAKMSRDLREFLESANGLLSLETGIVPDSMRPALRRAGLDYLHVSKFPPRLRQRYAEIRNRDAGDWILVDGRFAHVYMSSLAALLSKQVNVSPLTNEPAPLAVNMRCLIDDVAASGETAARGVLVSLVMKGLRIDPAVPVQKLIAFRRAKADQLAELAGLFEELKARIEKADSAPEMEEKAKKIYNNKVRVGLNKLKRELDNSSVLSSWEGVQRGIMVSAAGTGALALLTGYTGPMLLGAAAAITLADVGVRSYFARSKARASSPYSYLLDAQDRFSLPRYS